MTRFLPLAPALALAGLLAGCAAPPAQSVWLKPGIPEAEARATFAACRDAARAQFPERGGIATSPNVTIGVGVGDGGLRGGLGGGVQIYNIDRNEGPRDSAVAACMARQGYALASLPGCQGTVTPLASQPFDTRGVCVTRDGRLAAR